MANQRDHGVFPGSRPHPLPGDRQAGANGRNGLVGRGVAWRAQQYKKEEKMGPYRKFRYTGINEADRALDRLARAW